MRKSFKKLLIIIGLGCVIYIINLLIFNKLKYFYTTTDFLIDFCFTMLYTFLLSYANMVYFGVVEKQQWKNYDTLKRIVLGIFGATIITLACIFCIRLITATAINNIEYNHFIANETWRGYAFGFWVTIIIISFFYIAYFYNKYQKTKIKEQKIIAGSASAKFDALKNQLDPHFLFNSLNVLTSLIEENPKSAQKFTTALSKVYRYVLEQKNKELVTLDEELNFAKTYMSLLKMRFEDSIIFEIPENASNPEQKVVPLSLQLLLENAVKHNMVTASKPLHIKIYEDGNYLVVQNNRQPKQIVKKSSGVGLSNIQQRYKLLTQRNVYINQRDKDFAVAIPMLSKQVTIMKTLPNTNQHLNDDYLRAKKRVEELKGFYYSIVSYAVVIPLLIFIWYQFTPYTIQWFWFPIVFWGLSNVIMAYRVFVNDGAFGAKWEQQKIEEYMKKDQQNRWK